MEPGGYFIRWWDYLEGDIVLDSSYYSGYTPIEADISSDAAVI